MSFGLCNAPATFQRCMLSIFSDMVERIMELFMDDITIYGSTFDECLVNLEAVLNRCIEKDLVLNWEKCHFMNQQTAILRQIQQHLGLLPPPQPDLPTSSAPIALAEDTTPAEVWIPPPQDEPPIVTTTLEDASSPPEAPTV
ncbi:hypothetical protein VitviT2T_021703 [Vitis vinifera]|uniref:Reverse transcriptase domain-containing protein n=1 Tax=Vitis vinifera TaxID=29760 RepID=A0ABY9D7T2_VITVI|nr:hypothetical protein VitviT2T_021703 [Vitis vinifera]